MSDKEILKQSGLLERAIGRIKEFKMLSKINSTHLLPDLNKVFTYAVSYLTCLMN